MRDIWKIIADIGIEFHPDRVNAIAYKLAVLQTMEDFEKAISSFGPATNKALIDDLAIAWKNNAELTPLELAAAIRGASATANILEDRDAVELVWTGPSTGLVPSRHTEQVLLEVIGSAIKSLFIVSFVAYDIESIMTALKDASQRNVKIDILLESSKSHGGKVDIDSTQIFRKKLPSASIYVWKLDSKPSGALKGAVHAKCAVSDGSLAFITSANLTLAAMENNMELGILVRGGSLPEKLNKHLNALVTTGVIETI